MDTEDVVSNHEEETESPVTFKDLVSINEVLTFDFSNVASGCLIMQVWYNVLQGLRPELIEACTAVNWKAPTLIQREAIPLALQGL